MFMDTDFPPGGCRADERAAQVAEMSAMRARCVRLLAQKDAPPLHLAVWNAALQSAERELIALGGLILVEAGHA